MTPSNAPGCFAAATVFSHDSTICQGCAVFDACASESLKTIEAIKNIVNVKDLIRRHQVAKKVANDAIKAADQKHEAETPPGNINMPLPSKPVERKTQVVDVQFDTNAGEEEAIARMQTKPKETAVKMCKRGDIADIRKGLAQGRNAFATTGYPYFRVAIDMLLAGGFTKRALESELMTQLGWKNKASASSHANIVIWIMTGFKLAQEKEGRFVLIPELSA